MRPHDSIAITGLGVVCALGNDLPTALAAALAGESGLRRYQARYPTPGDPTFVERVGGTVEGFDPRVTGDARFVDRYEPAVNFAVAAAAEALADARLTGGDIDPTRVGCILGAGLPGAELWHQALHAAYAERRPRDIRGLTAVGITGNAAAGILALKHGLRGPSMGVATACASGATAIGVGADQIRLGRADAMLVGGAESSMRSLLSYASFAAAGGMDTTTDPSAASAPFALGRRGFVLGEGAAVLVLERLESAAARRARIYGLLRGEAHGNDAFHVINPDPSGEAWARVLAQALVESGVAPTDVDIVLAHAAGTPQGDVAETRAIRRVFGAHADRLAVPASKSMHGHAFGATAAIETVLGLAAAHAGWILPTIRLAAPDPACDLDHVPNRARPARVRTLVKDAFGAGGAASCLVIEIARSALTENHAGAPS